MSEGWSPPLRTGSKGPRIIYHIPLAALPSGGNSLSLRDHDGQCVLWVNDEKWGPIEVTEVPA